MEKLNFDEALTWRYATKRMTGDRIPDEKLEQILRAIKLAPTSRGLQPFKVIVIDDPAVKSKIMTIADGQPQVLESSHLLVFVAWSSVNADQINNFITYAATERGLPEEKLAKMKSVLVKDQLPMNDEQFYQWASKQAYIALAFALSSAAVNQVDASAMEGFDNAALDDLLNLKALGLRSTVLLALGYRDVDNDWLLKLKKVRRKDSELFIQLSELTLQNFL